MAVQRIQSFKYIPDSNHLKMNEESYLRESLVDLEAAIANAFSQDNGPIKVIITQDKINKEQFIITNAEGVQIPLQKIESIQLSEQIEISILPAAPINKKRVYYLIFQNILSQSFLHSKLF